MKELTIEEKAKRYDEAIKLINTKWYYKNQPCFINVSELFPEFKENKDENIKKWLIEYFQEFKSTGIEGFANGLKIDNIVTWLEKQGKQKSTDKIEPKFKVGDWIIDKQGIVHQIKNVIENVTNHIFGYDIVGGGYFNDNSDVRLWTINDAKEGDVLCTYECDEPKIVFVLKGTPKKHYALSYYCYYNIMYPYFEPDSKTGCLAPNEEDVKPATEEQRNILFQKIKEAGYIWNYDTKVINKITTISKRQISDYCYVLDHNTSKVFKHCITKDEVGLTTEELLKKYGLNEDECSIMYASNNLELELLED